MSRKNIPTRTDSQSTPSRRRVLGAIGATAGAVAASGVASAADTASFQAGLARAQEVKAGYGSSAAVEAAVEAHAADLTDQLADRGLLDAGDASALALAEPTTSVAEYHAALDRGEPAVHVDALETDDGVLTAHISASVWTDQGRLSVHVQPGTGEAHAMLRDGDGGGTLFSDGDVGTAKDCWYECSACEKTWCSSDAPYREYEKYCCLYADGTTECEETGDACANCC
jgi:hypothetical protein